MATTFGRYDDAPRSAVQAVGGAAMTKPDVDKATSGAGRGRALRGAVAAYVVSRFLLYVCFSASASDVFVYFRYAVAGVDHGLVAYRDIPELEYPPTAYWTICLPRLLTGDRFATVEVPADEYDRHVVRYDRVFRGLMLVFDAASFALFLAIVRRRRPDRAAWAAWGFVLATSLLGYVLLERLDVGVTLSILAWAYCSLRSDDDERRAWLWSALGYAALGFGISFKLIPLLLVPFPLWTDALRLRRTPRDWRLLLGPVVLAATAVGPYAYYYATVGDDLGRMFRYHSVRGVEIESVAATVMMLGEPRDALRPYYDYGSWNLGGAWERPLVRLTNYVLLAGLGLLGLRALSAPRIDGRYDGAAAYRLACVTIPFALVAAKVFSVQYLLWGLPLVILAAAEFRSERLFRGIVVACLVMAALTSFIFPFHFVDQMYVAPYGKDSPPMWLLIESIHYVWEGGKNLLVGTLSNHGPPVTVMIVRNLLFVACTATCLCAALRRSPTGSTPFAPRSGERGRG